MATPTLTPPTDLGELVVTQQAAQSLLVKHLGDAFATDAFPHLDPTRIQSSLPKMIAVVMALIHRYGKAAAVHAGDAYVQQRAAAGIPGRVRVAVPELPGMDAVLPQMRWAVNPLYGDVTEESQQATLSNLQGVTTTLVLDQARGATFGALAADKAATGWARIPEPDACYFCLLLATRGAQYKEHSFDRSNARFVGSGKFKVHNHCECLVQPTFDRHYRPDGQVQSAQDLYAATPPGVNAAEHRNNFRVAVAQARAAGRL